MLRQSSNPAVGPEKAYTPDPHTPFLGWSHFLPRKSDYGIAISPFTISVALGPEFISLSLGFPHLQNGTRNRIFYSRGEGQFFFFFFAAPQGMWDLISLTGDGNHIPSSGRWSLNHWTTRKVPGRSFLRIRMFTYVKPPEWINGKCSTTVNSILILKRECCCCC